MGLIISKHNKHRIKKIRIPIRNKTVIKRRKKRRRKRRKKMRKKIKKKTIMCHRIHRRFKNL